MSEKRVKLSQIVKTQLPSYVQENFPLVGSFLSGYYQGQEYKGGPVDLIQNIDSTRCCRINGHGSLPMCAVANFVLMKKDRL